MGIGTGNAFTLATICMVGTRVPRVRIPRQSTSDCGHAGLMAPLLLREAPVKQSFAPFDALAPFARAITRMPRPTRAAKRQPFSVFDVTPMLRKECSITIPPRSARPKHNHCHDFFNVFRFPNSRFPIPNFHEPRHFPRATGARRAAKPPPGARRTLSGSPALSANSRRM